MNAFENVHEEDIYETEIINLRQEFDRGVAEGARLIRMGELVAFPTETVYGLGADALRSEAASTIFAAKGRPADNPLIVHVAELEEAFRLAYVTPEAERLMEAFWPGPLTIILRKKTIIPYTVSGGLETVGLRMPEHAGALALIREAGTPIAAPSANRSGRPSPTTAQDVYEDMKGRIPLILDGGASSYGMESTVLSLAGTPTILRPGMVLPEMVAQEIGYVELGKNVLQPVEEGSVVLSPGMKYRHYAPSANVTLVEDEGDGRMAAAIAKIYDRETAAGKESLILATEENSVFYGGRNYAIMGSKADAAEICRSFFRLLREADRCDVQEIIVEAVPARSCGLAFMNRALRAAAFRVFYAGEILGE